MVVRSKPELEMRLQPCTAGAVNAWVTHLVPVSRVYVYAPRPGRLREMDRYTYVGAIN